MKRRQFLQAAGTGLLAGTVAKPAIAQSMPQLKWRLTSSYPQSLGTLWGAIEVLSKAVAEATDNKFQIQIFPPGAIVPPLQVVDAVQNGTVEMGNSASYYYFGKDPTFAFGTAVPFGLNSRMQTSWWHFGGGAELMNELYAKFNMFGILAGNTGCQMGGWFRKEIKDLADLKGLKMRIGGYAGTIIAKLGVVPQQIAGGDLYPSIEKGTIDAAEWVGPYDDEKLGLYKVAQYYYYPGWWEGGAMIHNFVNLEKWNALSPTYKSILITASSKANEWMQGKYDAENPAALKRLLANGAQLRAFPPAVMDASLKAAMDTYAEVSAANPLFKKVWDSYLPFRNDQYLWWQVAELSYDSYMVRNRNRM